MPPSTDEKQIAKYINRDLSWLSFNERVLHEAKNKDLPLMERIRFLAIYSSNLDEFFRVRVAGIRQLVALKKKATSGLNFKPKLLLKEINRIVNGHLEEFYRIFNFEIIPELAKFNVEFYSGQDIAEEHNAELKAYFQSEILQHVNPQIIDLNDPPFLENRLLYLFVTLKDKRSNKEVFALVEIPSSKTKRFYTLKCSSGLIMIYFIDDIIRINLKELFEDYIVKSAYSIKLNRDAELYIEDEFSGDLKEKVIRSLMKRSMGEPSRLVYDKEMPDSLLRALGEIYSLSASDFIPGGRYHNRSDMMKLENPDKRIPEFELLDQIDYPKLNPGESALKRLNKEDVLLNYPYHSFKFTVEFVKEMANDPKVKEIYSTLYRVSGDSKVLGALIKAAKKGKKVTVFVEIKARFDEEQNLRWAGKMERAGIKVLYSFPAIKVHCKMLLVKREKGNGFERIAYMATGNFNETTAKIYSDFGFFTTNKKLTKEVEMVFGLLSARILTYDFKHLLVAPHYLRSRLNELVDAEIANAQAGLKAEITMKLNSLEDRKMINRLYSASQAGVKINLIVRGICSLVSGIEGLSENINVISIVGRFLEHARIYKFHANGEDKIYLSSADIMRRNLSYRIEVAFPIYDAKLKYQINHFLDLQFSDNVKARYIDANLLNKHVVTDSKHAINSQIEQYHYLAKNS